MKKIITFLCILFTMPIFAQWIQQNSGTTANLKDVYCISQDIVVVVGDGGVILKSTDVGVTWVQKTSGTTSNLKKVQFPTNTTGYSVGSNGILLKTVDQGENWINISNGIAQNLFGLSCLSDNNFFVSGDSGLVLKSNDGGNTFVEKNITSNQSITDIQFLNEQIGYSLVGTPDYFSADKILYKTTNGGTNWAQLLAEPVNAFFFLNEDLGFISKTNTDIYKTIDGGINLQNIGFSNVFEIAIFSNNENLVWNIGVSPALCFCTYSCISKRELLPDSNYQQIDSCNEIPDIIFPFESIHFANSNVGFIVGINGVILKNSNGINENLATTGFSEKQKITIYPNSATNQIMVSLVEIPSQSFNIEVTNMLGKKVYSQSFQPINNVSIDTNIFSKGVYFLTVINQEKRETQKLVIN